MAGSTGALRKRCGMGLVRLGMYIGLFQAEADLVRDQWLDSWLRLDIGLGYHPDLYSHSTPTG